MTDIVAGIDAYMTTKYASSFACKFYGFCELTKRSTTEGTPQPIPVTINGTHKREQVAIDDRFQLLTWIRSNGAISLGQTVDDQDWGFGLDSGNVSNASLRMVVAHRVEYGENLIIDIARGLPSLIDSTNYKIISIDKRAVTISDDHETIYNTELGSGQYEKHRTPWNLYVINIPIQYIRCGDFDENFRLTESGFYREIEH